MTGDQNEALGTSSHTQQGAGQGGAGRGVTARHTGCPHHPLSLCQWRPHGGRWAAHKGPVLGPSEARGPQAQTRAPIVSASNRHDTRVQPGAGLTHAGAITGLMCARAGDTKALFARGRAGTQTREGEAGAAWRAQRKPTPADSKTEQPWVLVVDACPEVV